LNQGQFENLLRNISSKKNNTIVPRLLTMVAITTASVLFLNTNIEVAFIMFLYMSFNMIVLFQGAMFFHFRGNNSFLGYNIIFYITNLLLTSLLIAMHLFNAISWLLSSIVADLLLLLMYKKSNLGKTHNLEVNEQNSVKIASIAAILAAVQDFLIILVASRLADQKSLAFLVVSYSCVSPLMIFLSSTQNLILSGKKFDSLVAKNIALKYLVVFILPILIVFYFLIKILVPILFGSNYQLLSDYSFLVVIFGLVNLGLKFANTLYRGKSNFIGSIALSFVFILTFILLGLFIPTTSLMLVQLFIYSGFLTFGTLVILHSLTSYFR
jgi:hypothetical protein